MPPTPPEPRVFAYVRVSTHKQEHSCEAQRTLIEKYCSNKGLANPQFFVDTAVSAKSSLNERPAGGELVRRLRPGDHLVITRLDRAFRKFRDCVMCMEEWMDQKINFHCLQLGGESLDLSTPIGKYMVRMLSATAQFEREIVSERTREVIHTQLTYEFPNMGFKWDKVKDKSRAKGWRKIMVVDEVERAQMAQILHWKQQGMTFTNIQNHINELGWKRSMGRVWSRKAIWKAVHAELENLQQELQDDRDLA